MKQVPCPTCGRSGWIPVSEGLPEIVPPDELLCSPVRRGWVLTIWRGEYRLLALTVEGWMDEEGDYTPVRHYCAPTHWQPLPPEPDQ